MSVFTQWSKHRNNVMRKRWWRVSTMPTFLFDINPVLRWKSRDVGNARAFMASDSVVIVSQRCLYENDEVCVEHSVMDFADGTREAMLSFHRLQDGKIVHTETGATPVEVPR